MTGINHALTGGIIGVSVANPLAIPIAFISHFVLDALPHYGFHLDARPLRFWVWKIDVILIVLFVMGSILLVEEKLVWVLLGSVVAMSPDFAWVYRFAFKEQFGKLPKAKLSGFNKFHANIQTRESAKLLPLEALVYMSLLAVFIWIQ